MKTVEISPPEGWCTQCSASRVDAIKTVSKTTTVWESPDGSGETLSIGKTRLCKSPDLRTSFACQKAENTALGSLAPFGERKPPKGGAQRTPNVGFSGGAVRLRDLLCFEPINLNRAAFRGA